MLGATGKSERPETEGGGGGGGFVGSDGGGTGSAVVPSLDHPLLDLLEDVVPSDVGKVDQPPERKEPMLAGGGGAGAEEGGGGGGVGVFIPDTVAQPTDGGVDDGTTVEDEASPTVAHPDFLKPFFSPLTPGLPTRLATGGAVIFIPAAFAILRSSFSSRFRSFSLRRSASSRPAARTG